MEKIVGSALELSPKRLFTLDKYRLKMCAENSDFAIHHIVNRKKYFWSAPPPPCCDQTNPLAYSRSFTLHKSYENGMIGQRGEGCQNAQKLDPNSMQTHHFCLDYYAANIIFPYI